MEVENALSSSIAPHQFFDPIGSSRPITALAVRVELTRCYFFEEVHVRLCRRLRMVHTAYTVSMAYTRRRSINQP